MPNFNFLDDFFTGQKRCVKYLCETTELSKDCAACADVLENESLMLQAIHTENTNWIRREL